MACAVIAAIYGAVGCQEGVSEKGAPPDWHLRLADSAMDGEVDAVITSGGTADINVLDQVYLKDGFSLVEDTVGDFHVTDATMEITSRPEHGTAVLGGDGMLVYTPDEGYAGSDRVAWSVRLKQASETVIGTFEITVEEEPEGVSEELPGERWADAYENCADARADGHAPVREGEKGYAPWLDRDGDGVGCDWG